MGLGWGLTLNPPSVSLSLSLHQRHVLVTWLALSKAAPPLSHSNIGERCMQKDKMARGNEEFK